MHVPANVGYVTEKDLEPKRKITDEEMRKQTVRIMNQSIEDITIKELKKVSKGLEVGVKQMFENQQKVIFDEKDKPDILRQGKFF